MHLYEEINIDIYEYVLIMFSSILKFIRLYDVSNKIAAGVKSFDSLKIKSRISRKRIIQIQLHKTFIQLN